MTSDCTASNAAQRSINEHYAHCLKAPFCVMGPFLFIFFHVMTLCFSGFDIFFA